MRDRLGQKFVSSSLITNRLPGSRIVLDPHPAFTPSTTTFLLISLERSASASARSLSTTVPLPLRRTFASRSLPAYAARRSKTMPPKSELPCSLSRTHAFDRSAERGAARVQKPPLPRRRPSSAGPRTTCMSVSSACPTSANRPSSTRSRAVVRLCFLVSSRAHL